MRHVIAAIALATAGAAATFYIAPLTAQETSPIPGAKDASRVTGGTYAVEPTHSLVGWRVNHLGFNDYFGIVGDVTGTLTLDPANPSAAKLDVKVPISKILTASPGLTEHMLKPGVDGGKPDFFGANPADAHFVSTSVTIDDDGDEATIMGDLTLNGITKPVTIEAEFVGAGADPMAGTETIGFEGEATIRRSEFGIGYGVPLVTDEVELDITIAFLKQ